jgi:hypothetical protein
MLLADYSSDERRFEFDSNTGLYSHVNFLCELSLHQDGRCIRTFRYFRRDWFAAIIDSAYDELDFSLVNLPVDFEPHGLSSIQKQREDFIAMWSIQPKSEGGA